MSNISKTLSQYWWKIQGNLFPYLEEELDPLTKKQKQLITTLEIIRIESFIPDTWIRGRPPESRIAIARSFIAKSIYNISTTRMLLEQLTVDKNLRRICGWEYKNEIPSESTFSRAFEEFANTKLIQRIHEQFIKEFCKEDIILHISSDSTAIESREKPQKKEKQKKDLKIKKLGRPKKGENRPEKPKEFKRIEKQLNMTLDEMLEDLPNECDVGCKKNSQGYIVSWNGYKLHISTADGGIPISAILTSASLHDSQAIIPLLTMNVERVVNLYDLCDAAYYDPNIENYSRGLNHKPIIDVNPRRNIDLKNELKEEAKALKNLNWKTPEDIRYNERTTVERTNARLKDEFGGRNVRVKGSKKVMCHLMFGLLALAIDQAMRFIT